MCLQNLCNMIWILFFSNFWNSIYGSSARGGGCPLKIAGDFSKIISVLAFLVPSIFIEFTNRFLGAHHLYMNFCLCVCPCVPKIVRFSVPPSMRFSGPPRWLGHLDTGTLGHWTTVILGHWNTIMMCWVRGADAHLPQPCCDFYYCSPTVGVPILCNKIR